MMLEQQRVRAASFFKDTLYANGVLSSYNPNSQIRVGRYVRVTPKAGAALYPVSLELHGAARARIEVEGPGWYDLGTSQADARIRPRSFSDAFCPNQPGTGKTVAPIAIVRNSFFPAGWPTVASAPSGFSGFTTGDFLVESCDSLEQALALQGPQIPSTGFLAAYDKAIRTGAPSSTAPILLPDYNACVEIVTPPTTPNNPDSIFLGCGARTVRYTFIDSGAGVAASFNAYILGPFSIGWEKAGVINVDPGAGNVMVREETIDIDTPLWVYLQALQGADNDYQVTVQVMHQPVA